MKPAIAEEHQCITCLSTHPGQKELLKVQNTVIALKLLEEPAGANQRQAKKGLSTADFWVKEGMQDHFLRQTPGGGKSSILSPPQEIADKHKANHISGILNYLNMLINEL